METSKKYFKKVVWKNDSNSTEKNQMHSEI